MAEKAEAMERVLGRECFWCGGNKTLECVICEQTIPCMFCGGTGLFTPELTKPAHVCPQLLAHVKTVGGVA